MSRNLTKEERQELKHKLYKVLNSLQSRTVFSESTYESMNQLADEFTSALYDKIDEIWARNTSVEQIREDR